MCKLNKSNLIGNDMKIFISGITGYVGRNLAKHFLYSNDVTGLSRDLEKSLFLEELGVKILKGDLHSKNLINNLADCDVLIHTAADTDHKNISNTQYDTNVTGTELLLKAAKEAGVKKFIHISTESVLLTGKALRQATEEIPYPKNAIGSYSSTKQLAENLVIKAASEKFSTIVLRPRFVWGRDDTTAIPQILKAIKENQFAWIDGGKYKTSMTHIDNLCAGIECAISQGNSGEVYFLSDDDDKIFKDLISALVEAHGIAAPDKVIPRFVPYTIAKLDNICRKLFPNRKPLPITMQEYSTSAVEVTLDITKAKKYLGYKPVISFSQGLSEIKRNNC